MELFNTKINPIVVISPLCVDNNSLFLSNFCLCDYRESPLTLFEDFKRRLPSRRKATLLISFHKFDLKAEALLKELIRSPLLGHEYFIQATRKSAAKSGPICDARSNFIGVSKNGKRWQSLIHINKVKNYIATYDSEEEAAISFDFHCALLKKSKAKTNFSYTKGELIEMIYKYRENGYSI